MFQKVEDTRSGRGISSPYSNILTNPYKQVNNVYPSSIKSILYNYILIFSILFIPNVLYITCSPPPPVTIIKKCPKPYWKEYSSFQPDHIRDEIARLETLLTRGDTTSHHSDTTADSTDTTDATKNKLLSSLEIKRRLFELSIHQANPDYNISKIYEYAIFLYNNGGPDSLRYLNWSRMINERRSLQQERDSLKMVISDMEEKGLNSSKKLQNEKRYYLKKYDSLKTVIADKQEMILKLQKLDVMMEQQRNKIQ